MKKFQFSLQRLLNFKEQAFEIEMTVLAEMNAVLASLQNELIVIGEERKARILSYNQKVMGGIAPMEISLHKVYLKALEESIEQKKIQIAMQKKAVEKQTEKVREAKIEISTIEKLKEKKLEEYNYLANKAQELFIEEFVSTKRAMNLEEATVI